MRKMVIMTVENAGEELLRFVEALLNACVTNVILVRKNEDAGDSECFDEIEALPGCTVLTNTEGSGADAAMMTGYLYYKKHFDGRQTCVFGIDGENSQERSRLLKVLNRDEYTFMGLSMEGIRRGFAAAVRSRVNALENIFVILSARKIM